MGAVVEDKIRVGNRGVEVMEGATVVKLFAVEAEDATVIPRHSYEPRVFWHCEPA